MLRQVTACQSTYVETAYEEGGETALRLSQQYCFIIFHLIYFLIYFICLFLFVVLNSINSSHIVKVWAGFHRYTVTNLLYWI